MAGTPLPPELSRALAGGATVVTANQRAARTLRRQVDHDHHAQGHTTWQPPSVAAWESWTAALWKQLLVAGRATALLLNPAQEHSLWHSLIAADPEWTRLPSADALAQLAAEAFARLCAHSGESQLGRDHPSADTRAFARWLHAFTVRCRSDDLLPVAQLEARLSQLTTPADLPTHLLLVGFDGLTPARQALLARCESLGTTIQHLAADQTGSLTLTPATTEDEELATAARWLRDRLVADPTARLALIVPGLATRRAEVDRVLRRTLNPAPAAPLFEFSLGLPLTRIPAVAVALDLLRWPVEGLTRERVTRILLSPALSGHTTESLSRAAADAKLRRERTLRPAISLDRLLRTLDTTRIPILRASLWATNRAAAEITPAPRSYADWANLMRSLLSAARWGEAADGLTFQAQERWESVLDQAATLDFTGLRVSYSVALATVERLATDTLFAPESEDAPIQIMGPLESAGSNFDALWFLGAGDLTWPTRAATSPLLPWTLQHHLGMPGTDAAADLAHAQRLATRIAQSASEVIFSYAERLAEEAHQRSSPALNGLAVQPVAAHASVPVPPPRQPVTLETLDDSHTLPPLPDKVLRGGASILQHQAACGFRAFAEHRLFASALDATRPSANFGFDPRDSGGAIHKILQLFWTRIPDQDALKSLTSNARRALITEAIEETLAPTATRNPGHWDTAYLNLQCERLLTLLDRWLLKETEREVPFQVRALERRLEDVRVGPLRLTLQVDRIDETEHGDVILDYKTGKAAPSAWLGERPDAPQLPLYAVLASALPDAAPLAGLAFVQLRAGDEMIQHGVQTETGLLLKHHKLGVPLAAQLDAWRSTLEGLAADFHRGDVRVRPKAYPQTCQYCEQRLLCRLDISLQHEGDADPLDEDDLLG